MKNLLKLIVTLLIVFGWIDSVSLSNRYYTETRYLY